MDQRELRELLGRFRAGEVDEEEVLQTLRDLPFRDLGFARLDTHRGLRKGFPEVVYGPGKSIEQILGICDSLSGSQSRLLVTRTSAEVFEAVRKRHPRARYYDSAGAIVIADEPIPIDGKGTVLVVTAGTSDISVAEEAAVTLQVMGNQVERCYDVGVAGIHRLLAVRENLESARCLVVVAGMEGALPSVVAGLVDVPVVAVPTSVGYGASFGGITALCAMLAGCSSGVSVVNIDNGFGAGYVASLINHL
jgi:NCAIR mutase (PurE)-related protein